MKKFSILLAVMLLGAITATSAMANSFTGSPSPSLSPIFGTLINFDDKAGPVLANDYVSLGVASITETTGAGTSFARYAGTQSSPYYIGTGFQYEITNNGTGWDGRILIQFAGLANKVGIGIADSAGGPETIYAYDSANNLLETYQAPTGANVYFGIERAAYDIKYFAITGDFFAVDDLQFNATSVPEPMTMLLLGLGLVGLAGARRFRK